MGRWRRWRLTPGDCFPGLGGSRGRRAIPREAGADGGGLRVAGAGSVCGVDGAQLEVFHVFEPLAPRLATDPGESPNPGWERWVKSWCLDFVSTYEIYWNVPGDMLDVSELPARAFDSPAQYAETATLAADYNRKAGSDAGDRCAVWQAGRRTHRGAPAAFLSLAAAGAHGGYVAEAARGESAHRSGLVGLRAPQRRDAIQLGLRRAECALSAAGICRDYSAAALLAADAGLLWCCAARC